MSDKTELIWERGALEDLARLREFIRPHSPKAAINAAQRIVEASVLLAQYPLLGRPIENLPHFYELSIPFGQRGYILRYRIDGEKVLVLRVWHGREER